MATKVEPRPWDSPGPNNTNASKDTPPRPPRPKNHTPHNPPPPDPRNRPQPNPPDDDGEKDRDAAEDVVTAGDDVVLGVHEEDARKPGDAPGDRESGEPRPHEVDCVGRSR